MKIIIHKPIWSTMSVGIADYKISEDLEVEIDYTGIKGEKLFPDTYKISKEKAKTFPFQVVKGLKLRIIPLNEMEVIKKNEERKK